jgi:hypothetical protein
VQKSPLKVNIKNISSLCNKLIFLFFIVTLAIVLSKIRYSYSEKNIWRNLSVKVAIAGRLGWEGDCSL